MDKNGVYDYLKKQLLAVLAVAGPDNSPYAATMFYTVDELLNFYFFSKKHTKKIQYVIDNKHAAVAVIDQEQAITVQGTGKIEVLEDPEKRTAIIKEIGAKNAKKDQTFWPPPLSKLAKDELIILKLTPDWLRYCDYTKNLDETEGIFYEVIPNESTY